MIIVTHFGQLLLYLRLGNINSKLKEQGSRGSRGSQYPQNRGVGSPGSPGNSLGLPGLLGLPTLSKWGCWEPREFIGAPRAPNTLKMVVLGAPGAPEP